MNYNISFKNSDCELRSYFLGLWITDGWLDKSTVRISSSDKQLIDDLAVATEFKNKIFVQQNRKFGGSLELSGTTQYTICYSSSELRDWLISLGFSNKKTGHEFIPDCVSQDTFWHFLRGVTDGDGTLLITEGRLRWSLVSASSYFLEQVLERIKPFLSTRSIISKNKTCYSIVISHSDSIRLGDLMYSNSSIKLNRKYLTYTIGKDLPQTSTRVSWTREEISLLLQGLPVPGRTKRQCECKLWHLKNS